MSIVSTIEFPYQNHNMTRHIVNKSKTRFQNQSRLDEKMGIKKT